jgi:tetratricopeptide (TPR) repeat protein
MERGADYYTRSLKLAQEIGDLRDQEQALGNLGTIYHQRGEWAAAERYYRQTAEICEAVGDEAGLAVWLGNLALVLGLQAARRRRGRCWSARLRYIGATTIVPARGRRCLTWRCTTGTWAS